MPRLPIEQQITFLMVRDLQATAEFYEQGLGLELAVDQGSCRIYRVVGDAYVGFCERPEAAVSAGRVILTLVTSHVDEWAAHLQAKGIELEKAPAENPTYRIYHCFVRDPDGYLIEIQRFLDPVFSAM